MKSCSNRCWGWQYETGFETTGLRLEAFDAGAPAGIAGLALYRFSLDLVDLDRGGSGHGHDHLYHRLRPHAWFLV